MEARYILFKNEENVLHYILGIFLKKAENFLRFSNPTTYLKHDIKAVLNFQTTIVFSDTSQNNKITCN